VVSVHTEPGLVPGEVWGSEGIFPPGVPAQGQRGCGRSGAGCDQRRRSGHGGWRRCAGLTCGARSSLASALASPALDAAAPPSLPPRPPPPPHRAPSCAPPREAPRRRRRRRPYRAARRRAPPPWRSPPCPAGPPPSWPRAPPRPSRAACVPCSTKEGWMVQAPNSASPPSSRKEAHAAAHAKVHAARAARASPGRARTAGWPRWRSRRRRAGGCSCPR
jgi:hypothetical protein